MTKQNKKIDFKKYVTNESVYESNRGDFAHNIMAKHLIEYYNVIKINGQLHIYNEDEGIYIKDRKEIESKMFDLKDNIKRQQMSEVMNYLDKKAPSKELAEVKYIHCKNGILNVENKMFTPGFNPNCISTTKLNVDYRPNIKVAELDKVLHDLSEGQEGYNLLSEMFGQTIYRKILVKKAIILYGRPGCGKSVIISMCENLISKSNYSGVSLQQMENEFYRVKMFNKLANINHDIPANKITDSAEFKKSVNGESIMAAEKGVQPFEFNPFATQIYGMNERPQWKDNSGAQFDRMLMIPFNEIIRGTDKEDKNLFDKIAQEDWKSHLLNLALLGLDRLIANREYTQPQSVIETLNEYRANNNPISKFIEENDITVNNKNEIYEQYVRWCNEEDIEDVLTKQKFSREVKELGYGDKVVKIDGSTKRFYVKK